MCFFHFCFCFGSCEPIGQHWFMGVSVYTHIVALPRVAVMCETTCSGVITGQVTISHWWFARILNSLQDKDLNSHFYRSWQHGVVVLYALLALIFSSLTALLCWFTLDLGNGQILCASYNFTDNWWPPSVRLACMGQDVWDWMTGAEEETENRDLACAFRRSDRKAYASRTAIHHWPKPYTGGQRL